MSIISEDMSQRESLVQQVQQVQLLVSEQDRKLYNTLYFYKDRLDRLVNQLVASEFTFLIYRVGKNAKASDALRDMVGVARRIKIMLRESHGLQLHRVQAILRQINLD